MSLTLTRLIVLIVLLSAASSMTLAHDGDDHSGHGGGGHGAAPAGPTPAPTPSTGGGAAAPAPAPTGPPATTVIWVSSISKSLTVIGTVTLVPNLQPAATPLPKPNDPKLPERPEANLVSREKVAAYCASAPKVSAPCAFWGICQELGDKAPSYVCGTTAIAKYVCDEKDGDNDAANAKELCGEWTEKCKGDKCKGLGWPRWQPSVVYQAASFKMCDFHAKRNEFMTGCDQCTVPPTGIPDWTKNDFNLLNKTCNSFALHGEMCSSMPGMGGCTNWRQMCSTLPNASELLPKWCWADAMAARNITYNATLANQFILDKAPATAESKGSGAVGWASGVAAGSAVAAFVLAAVMVL